MGIFSNFLNRLRGKATPFEPRSVTIAKAKQKTAKGVKGAVGKGLAGLGPKGTRDKGGIRTALPGGMEGGPIAHFPTRGLNKPATWHAPAGTDDEDSFLYFGVWYSNFSSSNVAAVRWIEVQQVLMVKFNNGAVYGYSPVDEMMARDLFHTSSKGEWVWNHLRIRGTQYGHQVSYWYDQGMSTHIPLYRLVPELERAHDVARVAQGGSFTGYFEGEVPGDVRPDNTIVE